MKFMVCIMQFTSLFYNTSFFYGKKYKETVVLSRWEGNRVISSQRSEW